RELVLLAGDARELRPEHEEVLLELREDPVHRGVEPRGACDAERGVRLVHGAVRVDARARLRDAAPAEEPRRAVVPRLRVELHRAGGWSREGRAGATPSLHRSPRPRPPRARERLRTFLATAG